MSDGLFDFVIKMCIIGSFLLFSLLGIGFALLSVFKIFYQFIDKFNILSTKEIDCKSKKEKDKTSKSNGKLIKNVKAAKT